MRSILRRGATGSFILSLALLASLAGPAAPAQAAWGVSYNMVIPVVGYTQGGASQNLGRVEGTVQFDDGGSALRYNLTFCRQSSYQLPYMTIDVDVFWAGGRRYATRIATVYANWSGSSTTPPCYSTIGTAVGEFSSANFYNVEFIVYGSTFVGQSHTIFTEDQTYYNPY